MLALVLAACDDKGGITGTPPTVTGTVASTAADNPVAGAEVDIGGATTTTGVDGRFELTDLTAGAATLLCTATGFEDFETSITVTDGSVDQEIGLTRIEVFEFGDFALYVPASVGPTRAIILALGGPNTKAFVTGEPAGAPVPASRGFAAGARRVAPDAGVRQRARRLGHLVGCDGERRQQRSAHPGRGSDRRGVEWEPDLPTAPLLMYGISGGAPRHPGSLGGSRPIAGAVPESPGRRVARHER